MIIALKTLQKNVFVNKNIIHNEDIYLETSSHNPFTISMNSNNLTNLISGFNANHYYNNNFKKFMKAKKCEMEKNEFTSEREFVMTTTHQKVLFKMFDVNSLEESKNNSNKNIYSQQRAVEVIVKINNSSITAFNVKTNFSVNSGEYFPIIHLNFNSVSASLYISAAQLICKIGVLGSEKAFLFEFVSNSFFDLFTQVLSQIIRNSLGSKINLHAVTLRNDYYKVVIFL